VTGCKDRLREHKFTYLLTYLLTKGSGYNIAFQSKADQFRTRYTDTLFCFCDLDFEPMTLLYELDVNIPKMHLRAKNELSR